MKCTVTSTTGCANCNLCMTQVEEAESNEHTYRRRNMKIVVDGTTSEKMVKSSGGGNVLRKR